MMKYRLKFRKTGNGKYVSHLDLLRCFIRAIARAKLPIKYSEGFNPHPSITFLLPLPIGVTSVCELVDMEFRENLPRELIMQKLNETLPPDLEILEVGLPTDKAKDLLCAKYEITLEHSANIDAAAIEEFLAREEILFMKRTKRGEKEANMAEYIVKFEFAVRTPNLAILNVLLSATSELTLKPNIVVAEVEKAMDVEFDGVLIERKEIIFR